MSITNGHLSNFTVLLIADPTTAQRLQQGLGAYHITCVEQAAPPADDPTAVRSIYKGYDAVIAPFASATSTLFQMLRAHFAFPERPLLVTYGQAGDASPAAERGDISVDDEVLAPMLTALLNQRREMLNTHRQHEQEMLSLKTDLREQQRIHDALEVLKDAIVQTVSHELRTPLLQVKAAVSMLAEDIKDSKLVELATTATARLETQVTKITLLGSSLNAPNCGPVIVREAVESASRSLRRSWERGDHTERVKVQLDTSLPPVFVDKQGIITVFQLLIDNALKFSEKEVIVSAERDGDEYIVVSVRDYGIGIARDQFERIFESFYQIDNTSTRRYGGLGIGLAIVRIILENHGTRAVVQSEPGEGTTISFRLPVAKL